MAPEVVSRKGHSIAADWWSYGVLMVLVHSCPLGSCSTCDDLRRKWRRASLFLCAIGFDRTHYCFKLRVRDAFIMFETIAIFGILLANYKV